MLHGIRKKLVYHEAARDSLIDADMYIFRIDCGENYCFWQLRSLKLLTVLKALLEEECRLNGEMDHQYEKKPTETGHKVYNIAVVEIRAGLNPHRKLTGQAAPFNGRVLKIVTR